MLVCTFYLLHIYFIFPDITLDMIKLPQVYVHYSVQSNMKRIFAQIPGLVIEARYLIMYHKSQQCKSKASSSISFNCNGTRRNIFCSLTLIPSISLLADSYACFVCLS